MTDEIEKVVEIGAIELGKMRWLRVFLRQEVTQRIIFVHDNSEWTSEDGPEDVVPPLNLKQVRQLRRLLGQAENKMRKLIDKMAKEKRRGKQG